MNINRYNKLSQHSHYKVDAARLAYQRQLVEGDAKSIEQAHRRYIKTRKHYYNF